MVLCTASSVAAVLSTLPTLLSKPIPHFARPVVPTSFRIPPTRGRRLLAAGMSNPTAPATAAPPTAASPFLSASATAATDTSAPGQHAFISYDGKTYRPVREGKAVILAPGDARVGETTEASGVQKVFYNPIQQFNRDLTVLAIKAFGEDHLRASEERRLARKERKASNKRKRDPCDGEGRDAAAAVYGEKKRDKVTRAGAEGHVSSGDGMGMMAGADAVSDPAAAGAAIAIDNAPDTASENRNKDSAPQDANGDAPEQDSAPVPHPGAEREKFTILDALSATGLRALRYALELPFVTSVTANDLTASAVEAIRLNVRHNGLGARVVATHEDALAHMYRVAADHLAVSRGPRGNPTSENRYNVVDLDPYGTAAPFFDASLQAVEDGGLLCVTCTDGPVWAGSGYPEKAYTLYGGVPVKGMHSHEGGLRLVLHGLAAAAARHGLVVEPLLSLAIDFYCRIFVRVRKSQAAAKFLASKTMVLFTCDQGCGAWETQYLMKNRPVPTKKGNGSFHKYSTAQAPSADRSCRHCGSRMHLGGPVYGGYIHSPDFIRAVLGRLPACDPDVYGTLPRLEGMLHNALEEVLLPEAKAPSGGGGLTAAAAAAAAAAAQPDASASVPEFYAAVDPVPFFFIPSKLSATVCSETPDEESIKGALRYLGYSALRSHCRPGSIKTDAPWDTIWWIMKEWVRQKAPVKAANIRPTSPAWRILGEDIIKGEDGEREEKKGAEEKSTDGDVEMKATVGTNGERSDSTEVRLRKSLVFDEDLCVLGRSRIEKRLVRYQINPRPHWGPMSKATGM